MAKARSHIAWMAGWRETKILKPIDSVIERMTASYQAVTKVNAEVAPKVQSPEGRAFNREAKTVWIPEIWLIRVFYFGGVGATA
jgi:hypothetical protein